MGVLKVFLPIVALLATFALSQPITHGGNRLRFKLSARYVIEFVGLVLIWYEIIES